MVYIVNIVASGTVNRELDLREIYQDIEAISKEYEPESHPGLHLRFEEDGPLITLYSSGSYTMMGAKSHGAVQKLHKQLLEAFTDLNLEADISAPEVQNIICKGDLEREVNLSALTVAFDFENTEYEPEQSPFLYYWPDEFDCVISIPANGEVVITGITEVEEAEEIFEFVKQQIESLFERS